MKKLTELLAEEVRAAFEACGYDSALGVVTVSNRPDLCEFQCNGSMKGAKLYKKAPLSIARDVAARLEGNPCFSSVSAAAPGFLNLSAAPEVLAAYLEEMRTEPDFGLPKEPTPRTIVVDYGGPNVAKPLHVGHLRSAIIGESIKRIFRAFGNNAIGDVHLGDWGLQMGLIIEQTRDDRPDLPYFDDSFAGEYPAEAPFSIRELEAVYPAASARAKTDEAFSQRAHNATRLLQEGHPGYMALWRHIMRISLADIRRNYDALNVSFELWKGESDAEPYIKPMVADLQARGVAVEDDGAWIIDVAEETDAKEVPPCILLKSDGATLYATTDLATLVQREADFRPDEIFYITDKRQALHFQQVFRAARKAGIIRPETKLSHLGFGTMNGKDGKPFKTREGGVMRLEQLIADITDFVARKIADNRVVEEDMQPETARLVAMAALKYGDLSNQPTKDYVFDMDRFSAFEGNTGPYLLYTIVRVGSILNKAGETGELSIVPADTPLARELMLAVSRFQDNLLLAYRDAAPNVICAYAYELCGAVNRFYHETRVLSEQDEDRRNGWLALLRLSRDVLAYCIDLLGFSAPEKM